jgi:sulfoxide reductase heme-binding subunit YedZ
MATSDMRFVKVALFLNGLVPVAMMGFDALTDRLGTNPVDFVTRTTGTMTLVFLVLTLAVTPARRIFGLSNLIKLRRMLGLYAFFYGLLHFTTYLWLDAFFDVKQIAADVVGRPFITVGLMSFLLMVPLAVTSTNGWIRRMGGKRWGRLHKYVYLIAVGGVVHFWMLVKADILKPLLFAVAIGLLLVYRVVAALRLRALRAK